MEKLFKFIPNGILIYRMLGFGQERARAVGGLRVPEDESGEMGGVSSRWLHRYESAIDVLKEGGSHCDVKRFGWLLRFCCVTRIRRETFGLD